jgi:hypothetical protein
LYIETGGNCAFQPAKNRSHGYSIEWKQIMIKGLPFFGYENNSARFAFTGMIILKKAIDSDTCA